MPLNFRELEKTFTRTPNYRVNVMWDYLEEHLKHWQDDRDDAGKLDLNPDFQREHVWTIAQQIQYVEYILQGGMSGRDIYFNCTGWMKDWRGPFVIVDGKQRLHAAREFMANRLPVFANLSTSTEQGLLTTDGKWNVKGFYRKDIEGRLGLNAGFVFHVNELTSRAEVLKWYLEMNTGGTPHTEDEIEKVKRMLKESK